MKRTISAEVGKGSVNHNSRKFKAENVDGSRTHLNIDYCNERIQTVYHQLFNEALKRYNEKQTRADRRIPNYYEKIRSGNQEKPFHEIILQIGNKEDMSATGEYAELSRQVLDKYYQGFQERNPNLRVFSAHLHMDEATPHIHIDFVPFTTGSKRGLDTRVSLKQALAAQGFKGGTRGATEWAQWVQSEKEQLAAVMERYDIQWEQKGTHEKHLSVLDYKKQEREKEIAALDSNTPLRELHLSDEMVALLKSGRINNRLLCELATHKDFIKFLADIEIYVDGIATMQIQNLNALVDTVRHEIIERYRPGEDDPHLKVLQAAHISDDEYFSHMVLDDLNLIIRDIREAHKKDSESAPQTTVADELKENLEAVENFKGSRDEKLVVLYCKQLGINYKNLSDEEFRWLIRILKKSKKMGTPISQRKKR